MRPAFWSLLACLLATLSAPRPALGQAPAAGWPQTDSGCQVVWNFPPVDAQVTWTGPCQGGQASGSGTATWTGGGETMRYDGEMLAGRRHGEGTLVDAAGARSTGQWANGRLNGKATTTWRSGIYYDGDYLEGNRHGHGTTVWPNGARYIGDMRNNKQTGRGTYIFANGDLYDGEFLEDRFHGQGTFVWIDGSRFEGTLRDDRPDGYGTFSHSSGIFRGTWVDGCFNDGRVRTAIGRPRLDCR